jgi:hypothetical protein
MEGEKRGRWGKGVSPGVLDLPISEEDLEMLSWTVEVAIDTHAGKVACGNDRNAFDVFGAERSITWNFEDSFVQGVVFALFEDDNGSHCMPASTPLY